MTWLTFELAHRNDLPNVERFTYTMPDGTAYAATVCRTIVGAWIATVTDPVGWPVWRPTRPYIDRSALIRRCTEEIDREARRRAV